MRFEAIAGGWCSAAIAIAANLFAAFAGTAFAQQTPAAPKTQQALISPSARCADPVARIASVQGLVELREPRTATWQRAQLNDALCLYDNIRVGAHSRASVQYSADVTVQFDQNSFVTLVEAKDKVSTWVQMWRGALHFITRSRRPFRVITPFVNASVEGTEVYIALAKDRADLTVFEGKLDVANDAGQVLLSSGESATVQGLEAITDDDQFRTLKAQAPQRVLIAKPRDTVQWALYYPPVIDVRPDENVHSSLKAAGEQFRAGNTAEAFAELDRVPVDNWDAQYFIYRASLLLYVGREQEAQADLAQALQQEAKKSDALALQTIIAVVQSDKEQGLSLAQKAVAADPASAAAQIALSYAQQAIFKLEAALQSAEQAAKLDPNNALAYARIAELQLSQGDLDRALAAAKKATELNPNLARTQSILGFSYLTRIDTKNAKETFAKAIQLDSADPLPHLGLGLAKIREGKLEEGRRDIEQAVILDPNNSLIRSYVGKAYYEEKRDELAGKQFEIAKQLDPNDPTPWFYDAVRKQTENLPTEALKDLEESIGRNEGRAVYRSQLLLDQDRAAREVHVARIYATLGLSHQAISQASKSVDQDPANYSAHRFLSDANAKIDRQEVAQTSELLQAQILQPLNASPVPPQVEFSDLSSQLVGTTGPIGLNTFGPLFDRNGFRVALSGLGGGLATSGSELIASGLFDRFAMNVGHYRFSTNGFRENNDVDHEIYNAFGQFSVSPDFSIQAEYRERTTSQGDIALNFDPKVFSPTARDLIDQKIARVGAKLDISAHSAWVSSALWSARGENRFRSSPALNVDIIADARRKLLETQIRHTGNNISVIAGMGYSDVVVDMTTRFDFTPSAGIACLPPLLPCGSVEESTLHQGNGYAYASFFPSSRLRTTLGISFDRYRDELVDLRTWSPKLGLRWAPRDEVELRIAGFRVLKRNLVTDQTIEPTQVAGFNQFYDDTNGALIKNVAVGFDVHVTPSIVGTFQAMRRDIEIPTVRAGTNLQLAPVQSQRDDQVSISFVWTASRKVVVSAGASAAQFTWDATIPVGVPIRLTTKRIPLSVRWFQGKHWFGEATATAVWQQVVRQPGVPDPAGREQFTTLDLSVGYLLPRRLGTIMLDVRNLFDSEFFYQDENFRSNDIRTPRYLPSRLALLKFNLSF